MTEKLGFVSSFHWWHPQCSPGPGELLALGPGAASHIESENLALGPGAASYIECENLKHSHPGASLTSASKQAVSKVFGSPHAPQH